MSIHHSVHMNCKRVTKQGVPCRNRAIQGAEYCFLHNVSEKRGWTFYLGLVGSLASIAGLAFFFLPSPQPHSEQVSESRLEKVNEPPRIPFYMTNINDETFFSVRGAFQGEFQIRPESVELYIGEADTDYPSKYASLGKRRLTAINAGRVDEMEAVLQNALHTALRAGHPREIAEVGEVYDSLGRRLEFEELVRGVYGSEGSKEILRTPTRRRVVRYA
jgi:hypothetical protein